MDSSITISTDLIIKKRTKFNSPEERAEAKRLASQRYYNKNKEKIIQNQYNRKIKKIIDKIENNNNKKYDEELIKLIC